MKIKAVLFDLDGTLVDTLADIAFAANHAMTQLGRPTHAVVNYRYFVGRGAAWLIGQALGSSHQHLVGRALSIYQSSYGEHGSGHARLYDGIDALLDELTKRSIKIAVLSNKPHVAVLDVQSRFLSRWSFDAVHGHQDGFPLKPDPAAALHIARELQIPPAQWLYLGDTDVDMATACAAQMFAVGVLWGFRDEAELRGAGGQAIIERPAQALDLL